MSFELVNQSTEISRKFSRQSWAKALELARSYGWQPRGTQAPPGMDFFQLEAEWNGTYMTNDGQVVKAEDAHSLAAALERALVDIPEVGRHVDWSPKSWADDDLPEWLSPAEKELIEEELQDGLLDIMGTDPTEYFAGNEKRYLTDFIRFCRLGSFELF